MFRLLAFTLTILCSQMIKAEIKEFNTNEIEVISYNTALARAMGKDFNPCVRERLQAMGKNVFKKTDIPTVYLLQEVFYTDAYVALAQWANKNGFYISASNAQRNGLVILSELPIRAESLKRFTCSKFMQNQGGLTATVEFKGKFIDLITSHTKDSEGDTPNVCQQAQLSELAGFFNRSGNTVIMGGDFNTGPDIKIINQTYDPIEKIWEPFKKILANAWRAPTETKGVTWDYRKNLLARVGPQDNSTLDHLFFKGSVQLVDYGIVYDQPVDIKNCKDYETTPGQTYMSDHYGVRARIRL